MRNKRVYETFDAALARFRLMPEQLCDNPFLVEFIGRHSLKRAGDGWVWKFDSEAMGPRAPVVEVPEARHHVMLDQPLGFVAALRMLLDSWMRNESAEGSS